MYNVCYPECFELQLIFSFEQSSFDYGKSEFNIPNGNSGNDSHRNQPKTVRLAVKALHNNHH